MISADWLEPELPKHAADLSAHTKGRLLAGARRDILQRTYTGTFAYPIFTVLVGWIVGLTDDYPRVVALVAGALGAVVVVRVFLYRRAIADTTRPSRAGRAHLLLGVASAAAFASAIGWAYLVREADSATTAGYVVMAGIAGTVVMIASTHRRLAIVWVLASIVPGLVVFAVQGSATAHMMFAMYVLYLPILRKMIDKGHQAYWDAQVSAARLDQQAHELARLSRTAGMAENATNVLHDVGNALNAVKTSTSCLEQSQHAHPANDLGRLVRLLDPHVADLSRFVAEDPRGAKLYPFIQALAATGAAHAEATATEIARLKAKLEHIEVIVRRQQEIATCVGSLEPIGAAELVASALGLSRLASASIDADVHGSIDPALRLVADRRRALQILVNLLDNASDATAGRTPPPQIRARAITADTDAVVIEISDNGCGIDEEVARRIFSRGFTTKAHGHGFGLHGSFALAQAMGGDLSFTSAGAGRGATFRLRLPRAAASSAA